MANVAVSLDETYIDDAGVAREHPETYHYTTVSAFERIVASGGIWASHYRRLGDHSEFQLAAKHIAARVFEENRKELRREVFRRPRVVKRIRNDHQSVDDILKEDCAGIPKAMTTLIDRYTPMHVASLTSHRAAHERTGGILTLWRGYGRGEGVALRFNTVRLLQILSATKAVEKYHGLYLSPVTYGNDDPLFLLRTNGLINGMAHAYFAFLKATLKGRKPEELGASFIETSAKFATTSILHKHPSFQDERELRLVAAPIVMVDPEDDRREPNWADRAANASRMLIDCRDAIDGAMIGPVENASDIRARVDTAFRAAGLGSLPILQSDIPVVDRRAA